MAQIMYNLYSTKFPSVLKNSFLNQSLVKKKFFGKIDQNPDPNFLNKIRQIFFRNFYSGSWWRYVFSKHLINFEKRKNRIIKTTFYY